VDPDYYDMYWAEKNAHGQTKKQLQAAQDRIADLESDLAAYRKAMREK
jgi:hypothetical protein